MSTVKQPATVYTNQKIAFGKDLVFGWVVLTEAGWYPVSHVETAEDLKLLEDAMDHNQLFPQELYQFIRERRNALN